MKPPAASSRIDIPLVRVGCAGWAIPARHAILLPGEGTHLQRYARQFNCVEINSSFHRPHDATTYRRWAGSVPADFRFSVKMPRTISHDARLRSCGRELDAFLASAMALGETLGCLLLQLPPSMEYQAAVAGRFFRRLRGGYAGPIACEPRHRSWLGARAVANLRRFGVALAAADPARFARAAVPGAHSALQYARLHGSPRMYYDAYDAATLARLVQKALRPTSATAERWIIFDNTAAGHALGDASTTVRLVESEVAQRAATSLSR